MLGAVGAVKKDRTLNHWSVYRKIFRLLTFLVIRVTVVVHHHRVVIVDNVVVHRKVVGAVSAVRV